MSDCRRSATVRRRPTVGPNRPHYSNRSSSTLFRGAGFRGVLTSRSRLGAARLHLGSHRCGCRWFLGQRSAFARQSRRLGPGGWLAGCVWGGRFPCSRCLSRALRCSLVAAFTHSGGLLRPPGTFGSRFAHSWSFEEPIIVGSYRSRSRPRARGLVKNPTLSELGMIFQRQARWFGVARPRSRRRKPGGSPPNFNYEWD